MNKNSKAEFNKALDDMTLGGDLAWFDYVLGLYDLRGYHESFRTHSEPAPISTTYHNDHHMQLVVLSACEGALYQRLTAPQTRILLLAAMFHDASHSCGGIVSAKNPMDTDQHNIDTAVRILRLAHETAAFSNKLTKENVDEAARLIRSTVYPRTPLAGHRNELASVLLDADRMTVYCADHTVRRDLFLGLRNETAAYLSVPDFTNQLIQFSTKAGAEWKTRWAKLKHWKLNWPKQFRDMQHQLIEHSRI